MRSPQRMILAVFVVVIVVKSCDGNTTQRSEKQDLESSEKVGGAWSSCQSHQLLTPAPDVEWGASSQLKREKVRLPHLTWGPVPHPTGVFHRLILSRW